jgi:hypothetical protein
MIQAATKTWDTSPGEATKTWDTSPDEAISTRMALKEWAVACEALGRGDQILLIRKGGIREQHREFRVEHPEFLLFPTYEHQRADLLKPEARSELAAVLAARGPGDLVELRYWASVVEVFEVTTSLQLGAVAPHHLWSEAYALERLRWRPVKPLQILALRVYLLAAPVQVPLLAEYGGCKSWLTLAEPVVVERAWPVLDDRAFLEALGQLRRALASATAAQTRPS